MFAKIASLGLFGLNAFRVDVEIDISRGQPHFEIVGLPDAAVRESRDRIRSSLRSSGITFPAAEVMVNLAPANTKKSGSAHDLAIFMAVVKALQLVDEIGDDCAFIGELSLNGDVRRINGVLPMVMLAMECGMKSVFLPADNAAEASVISGIDIYGVENVKQLIEHFRGNSRIAVSEPFVPEISDFAEHLDYMDVRGQAMAKYALELAAAGGHNVLLIGSPGTGKSMLAKRLPSILPPLTFQESLETTKVHSISGLLNESRPMVTERPFRSPHHTISSAGLAGGGSIPHPGEISLAHNGVLFLDELAEFDKRTLEILRQPLEDGQVTLARAAGTVTYPCKIMLVGAMNPCPCGYYGTKGGRCKCSPNQVVSYMNKVSGPLIDRFDLHVEMCPPDFSELSSDNRGESSASIRERIMAARKIQAERFRGTNIHCNAQMPPDKLRDYCRMDKEALTRLREFFDELHLSARGYDKILKVARTVADVKGMEIIDKSCISIAGAMRALDRETWRKGF